MHLSKPRFLFFLSTVADEIESGTFGKRSIDNMKLVYKKEGGKSLGCRREKIAIDFCRIYYSQLPKYIVFG